MRDFIDALLPLRKGEKYGAMIGLALLQILEVIFTISFAFVLGKFTNGLFQGEDIAAKLLHLLAIFFGLFLVQFLQEDGRRRFSVLLFDRYQRFTAKKFLHSSMGWFVHQKRGDILTRFADEEEKAYQLMTFNLWQISSLLLRVLANLGTLFFLHYTIALYLLPLLGLTILMQNLLSKQLQKGRVALFEQVGATAQNLSDLLHHMVLLQIEGKESWALQEYGRSLKKLEQAFKRFFTKVGGIMSIIYIFQCYPLCLFYYIRLI
ncbi:MAG: ABC transporter transmembrane domain-containing protein [Tissierellia bacterium]|nr:ABC transporter transmembrane domain-containing protein [Tissierellia bacterium]